MKHSFTTGLSFGSTSGIITTMGLMIGLHSGTHSRIAILGGILTIAIADAFSDALGIHISEESENKHSTIEIWEATVFTFLAKFFTALTFVIPVLFLEVTVAIYVNILWGMLFLSITSYFMSKKQGISPGMVITEHLIIAVFVVIIVHFVGDLIYKLFGNV